MHSGDVVEFDNDNQPPSMKHFYVYVYIYILMNIFLYINNYTNTHLCRGICIVGMWLNLIMTITPCLLPPLVS
jgi:hypothetical protein